jgi:hypothetical protein
MKQQFQVSSAECPQPFSFQQTAAHMRSHLACPFPEKFNTAYCSRARGQAAPNTVNCCQRHARKRRDMSAPVGCRRLRAVRLKKGPEKQSHALCSSFAGTLCEHSADMRSVLAALHSIAVRRIARSAAWPVQLVRSVRRLSRRVQGSGHAYGSPLLNFRFSSCPTELIITMGCV